MVKEVSNCCVSKIIAVKPLHPDFFSLFLFNPIDVALHKHNGTQKSQVS